MPKGVYPHKYHPRPDMKGKPAWNRGMKMPPMLEETKRKMSKAHKGKLAQWASGERSPNWKGGTSRKYRYKHAPRLKPDNCEVCGDSGSLSKKGLCLDHNHKTGKFRGWICFRCNVALGMVKDSIETLALLINYLEKSKD